jgi:hypothetical protein
MTSKERENTVIDLHSDIRDIERYAKQYEHYIPFTNARTQHRMQYDYIAHPLVEEPTQTASQNGMTRLIKSSRWISVATRRLARLSGSPWAMPWAPRWNLCLVTTAL